MKKWRLFRGITLRNFVHYPKGRKRLGVDGCLIRLCQVGVRNQQNLYPRIPTTDVAKLLQYSDFRVEHGDGFSS